MTWVCVDHLGRIKARANRFANGHRGHKIRYLWDLWAREEEDHRQNFEVHGSLPWSCLDCKPSLVSYLESPCFLTSFLPQFSSYKNELTVSKLKLLLNHFLLDGTFPNSRWDDIGLWQTNTTVLKLVLFSSKYAQFEPIKPLFVPFGADNLESIGLPALTNSELSDPSHRSLIDIWKTWFCKNFPQEVSCLVTNHKSVTNLFIFSFWFNKESKRDPSLLEDYGKDPQFEEPIIDNLRDQKMRELENLRELLIKRRSQQSQSIKIEMN